VDSSSVCILCKCWESVLQHGLKHSSQPVSTFKYVHLVTLRLCFKYYLFSLVVIVLPFYFCIAFMGYWHQRADKKLGDIPRYPGVFFSGQRQGWKTRRRSLVVHCFCVCNRSALLGDIFWVSRSMKRDLLSFLSIYPRIFLCVFIICRATVCYLGFFLCCILLYVHAC